MNKGSGNREMDEITPPRMGEFLRILFIRLWNERAGLPAADLLVQIPQSTPLSEFEKGCIPDTHIPRYERAIRLATIPLEKTGWLVKSKGRWYLTDEGKQACSGFPSAEAFYQEAARLFDEWRHSRSILALVTEEAEEKAWEQIRGYLQEMKPYEFQTLVGELLVAMGYYMTWAAPPGKDRGFVSFIVHTDSLGLSLPRIKVHVLHTGQLVLLEGLKAFMSVLAADDAGIFVSSGGFSTNVIEEVQTQKNNRITLIDLEAFFDLWVEYYEKLAPEARARFPLKPIHFLSPVE